MRTVVVGAGGMLGQDVVRATGGAGLTHAELDITDSRAVGEALGPDDLAINCAAWTDVDAAEEHAERALAVNGHGAGHVAEAAGAVVYVSTDYVFDGAKRTAYVESDAVNPLSSYGRSKLAGERATAAANPRHYIVRSAWLFGTGGPNFVEAMLAQGPKLRVVADQVGSPTFTGHLAEAINALVKRDDFGVHHIAAAGSCTRFEFAGEIFARAGREVELEPSTSEEYGRRAPRPAWSVLGSERGHRLPDWREGLQAYFAARA